MFSKKTILPDRTRPGILFVIHLLMQKIGNYFLKGLLVVAPIGITIYILLAIFNWLDSAFSIYDIPGLGIVVAALLITVVGFLASSYLVRPFLILTERVLHRTPLVSIIYTSLKDLLDAFVGDNQKFNCPVLVRVNDAPEAYRMGFITQEDLRPLNRPDLVAVYYPHSYNFSGELQLVPPESVTHLDLASSDVMKFIVSGGVSRLSAPVKEEELTPSLKS